ncbi:MAG: inorganic diphosphatase [Bacteroidota bacterium]|nr:inorganic diphosphatase [Bacteroidota bacterium]
MKFPQTFSGKGHNIYAVIETPQGSRNKYNYNTKYGFYELDKILPAGTCFPADFGFIPHTMAEDGDPLDVLVIMDIRSFTGCLVECRVIGVMEATQREKGGKKERNDRIIAVSTASIDHSGLNHVNELNSNFVKELTHFFEYYNSMSGKKFKIVGIKGPNQGLELVKKHMKPHKQ